LRVIPEQHRRAQSLAFPVVCILVLLFLLQTGCGGRPGNEPETLTVFAAASLSDVLLEIGREFEEVQGVKAVFNFAGSNVLASQILSTPRADIFLSASEAWMDEVEEKERLEPGTRVSFLSNALVVVAHPGSGSTLGGAGGLCGLDFKRLAMGDPESVPAGRYAREWLESVPCGEGTLWDRVKDRLSPTSDVRGALAQVESVRGMVGVVYRTDLFRFADRLETLLEIPADKGPVISYSAAVVKGSRQTNLGRLFLEFLQSYEAWMIFEKHGFLKSGKEESRG